MGNSRGRREILHEEECVLERSMSPPYIGEGAGRMECPHLSLHNGEWSFH